MASSLSNPVDNPAEGIHKLKYKMNTLIKKEKRVELSTKYKNFECYLEYTNVKDDLTKYKCLCCRNNYYKRFDEIC